MVASKIKLARIKRGKSQFELMGMTGIPQWRISLIERGVIPTDDEVQKISKALGCTPEEIFELHQLGQDLYAARGVRECDAV
jgi:transcriptional regulator with XRE-family HTH domain